MLGRSRSCGRLAVSVSKIPTYHAGAYRCLCINSSVRSSSVEISRPSVETAVDDKNYVRRKINELVVWYEQVTGMDEVRLMQNRVIEAQDRFVAAQESRRKLASELIGLQSKLKEIHSELNTTSRGEERYLQLITEEHKILKEERRIKSEFAIVERDERDSFSMLSSRLKESHEKERAQAERTKYWSIIGSFVGTVLGVAGSSINNELKMRELRKLVFESTARNNPSLVESTDNSAKELSRLLSDVRDTLRLNTENFVHNVSTSGKQHEVVEYIGRIDNEVKDLKQMLTTASKFDGQLVVIPSDLDSLLEKQKRDITNIVVGAALVAVILPMLFITFVSK